MFAEAILQKITKKWYRGSSRKQVYRGSIRGSCGCDRGSSAEALADLRFATSRFKRNKRHSSDEDEFPFPERERSRPYPMQEDPDESASRAGQSETSQVSQAKRRQDMATWVNKIVEGLRGDAFLVARDLGHEALMKPKGLETLVSRIRANVFPRATEEARELFRAGQRQGGVLSRQSGESMLSYTSRRRRWRRLLVEPDPSFQLYRRRDAEQIDARALRHLKTGSPCHQILCGVFAFRAHC